MEEVKQTPAKKVAAPKKVAAKKVPAKKVAAQKKVTATTSSSFDLNKHHADQKELNEKILNGKGARGHYPIDLKASYAASLPYATTPEAKKHLESVLAAHNNRKDNI